MWRYRMCVMIVDYYLHVHMCSRNVPQHGCCNSVTAVVKTLLHTSPHFSAAVRIHINIRSNRVLRRSVLHGIQVAASYGEGVITYTDNGCLWESARCAVDNQPDKLQVNVYR